MNIEYRKANLEDIDDILALQEKYHIDTIKEEYKKDGFVTTLFTREQFKELIKKEDGLSIAIDRGRIVAYAMAASWDYWSQWPLFKYMIDDLEDTTYLGEPLSKENSYQYGPICIEMDYRGSGLLLDLYEYSRRFMEDKYKYTVTFINQVNPRSYVAHKEKIGMDLIKTFKFNNQNYYELGYDTGKEIKNTSI